MRLAILGNSHSACLLHATRNDPAVMQGLEFTFFAAIGKNMADFAVQDDVLVPQTDVLRDSITTTSGGQATFDPRAYDAILMIGLDFNLAPLDERLSSAVQNAVIRNVVESSTSARLVGFIRQISDIPIFVGHTPLFAGEINNRTRPIVARAVSYDSMMALSEHYWAPYQVTLVRQPEHTRYEDVLTRRSFSQGSRGLRGSGEEHKESDRSHMNDDFGAEYLRHLRPLLGLG